MQTQNNQMPNTPNSQMDDDEINLMDIFLVIAKYNRFIIIFTVISALLSFVYTLGQPNLYTAQAVIMPPKANLGNSQVMGQLGAIAAIAGTGGIGENGGSIPFLSMLTSRPVAYHIIERFKLQALYKSKDIEEARGVLIKATELSTSKKEGLITIKVTDKDPKMAAFIANAYIDELDTVNNQFAFTAASRQRLFYEKHIQVANGDLAKLEIALKQLQKETDFGELEAQSGALLNLAATLRGQINAKEIELANMKAYATTNNPNYQKAVKSIENLRAQLRKLDRTVGQNQSDQDVVNKPSTAGSQYLHMVRDIKEQEAKLVLLKQQYEVAKIDESKDSPLIQVLENALIPKYPSKPMRAQIVAMTSLGALLISIALAFLWNSFESAKKNPISAENLNLMRRYFLQGK